jgi:hypothetical protein
MNFVLFHIGSPLPEHLQYCVKQIQHTNPGKKIYLITEPKQSVPDGIEYVDRTDLIVPDIGSYFYNKPMSERILFRNAMLRIFYLEAFMKKYNIENVIHFDNDVLIYCNVDEITSCLAIHDLLMTAHNEKQYVFGFSYIRHHNCLETINKKLLSMVHLHETVLHDLVDDFPSEMRLLKFINAIHDNKLIDMLPILSCNSAYGDFQYCFDPSSYGQYLGGLAPEQHHYIGREMIAGNLKVFIKNKLPYGSYNGREYQIFNLHIWNKKLEEFITYG